MGPEHQIQFSTDYKLADLTQEESRHHSQLQSQGEEQKINPLVKISTLLLFSYPHWRHASVSMLAELNSQSSPAVMSSIVEQHVEHKARYRRIPGARGNRVSVGKQLLKGKEK